MGQHSRLSAPPALAAGQVNSHANRESDRFRCGFAWIVSAPGLLLEIPMMANAVWISDPDECDDLGDVRPFLGSHGQYIAPAIEGCHETFAG